MTKMNRRNFLQSLSAGLTLSAVVPAGFAYVAVAPDYCVWSRSALPASRQAVEALCRHPFIRSAESGALPLRAFCCYMVLNAGYLKNYAAALSILSKRLTELSPVYSDMAKQLQLWADETTGVKSWCENLLADSLKAGNLTAADLPSTFAAGIDYSDFELHHVGHSHPAFAMSALLPCFWVYDRIGLEIVRVRQKTSASYWPWVESFGTQESTKSAKLAVDVADRLASELNNEERCRMTDIFLEGCWKEVACFDAAWRS